MISLVFAVIFCMMFCGTFLITYIKAKGQYDEYIDSLDKKEYSFKDFLPIGLYINERIIFKKYIPSNIYKYIYKYSNEINGKIKELYGIKYADYYFMIHNANKIAIGLTMAAGVSLLAVIMGVQGDESNCTIFVIFAIAAVIGMPIMIDKGLNDKIEKRRLSLQLEFPDFINKLTLLVNAGMTISKAWEKIATDNTKNSPLYNEMTYALAEIKAGKPEAVAYEEFGRRCKVKEIVRFVSIIILNLKKGGADVVPILKVQGMECWEMRKALAKRVGEEASTKILIPLMIMFVGIIIIVATPAILSFSAGM